MKVFMQEKDTLDTQELDVLMTFPTDSPCKEIEIRKHYAVVHDTPRSCYLNVRITPWLRLGNNLKLLAVTKFAELCRFFYRAIF